MTIDTKLKTQGVYQVWHVWKEHFSAQNLINLLLCQRLVQ